MRTLSILSCIITLNSCISNDGPYDDCDKYYFSKDFRDYVVFPIGSYWIYYDSINQVGDSIQLTRQDLYFSERCDYNSRPTDMIEQTLTSSYLPNNPNSLFFAVAEKGEQYNEDEHYPGGIYHITNWTRHFKVTNLDSIKVRNNWFYDIRVFEKLAKYDSVKSEYYWSKGVGLIKKVVKDPLVQNRLLFLDLVTFKINK